MIYNCYQILHNVILRAYYPTSKAHSNPTDRTHFYISLFNFMLIYDIKQIDLEKHKHIFNFLILMNVNSISFSY